MDEGLVHPCLELGCHEHRLLRWLTVRSNKRQSKIIPLDMEDMVAQASYSLNIPERAVRFGFDTLKDMGWLEQAPVSRGYGIFQRCTCSTDPPGRFRVENDHAALGGVANAIAYSRSEEARADATPEGLSSQRSEASEERGKPERTKVFIEKLGAKRSERRAERSLDVPVNNTNWNPPAQNSVGGPKPKYRFSPRVDLARNIFPQLCRDNGIPIPGYSWVPLAHQLRLWHDNYGITAEQAQQMMVEFVQHPQWCRRSKRAAWQVFLSRREQLTNLCFHRHLRDVGRFTQSSDWFPRHTPRASSTT